MEIISLLAAYLALGAFAGLVAGLLGVGGGLIIVPALASLFAARGFTADSIMQLALGTSLATILFTSLSSTLAHHRRAAVNWPIMLQLAVGIMLGGWLGGVLAEWMGGPLLAVVFGLFELSVAAQMVWGRPPAPHRSAPVRRLNVLAGAVIGALSALLGIGGGTLTVPYLAWHNVDIRQAVGTSAACGLPIALAGALGYILVGRDAGGLPAWSTGYVYWPAVAAISIASVSSAPLGARLAHRLERRRLKRVFAVFLALLGLWMVSSSLINGGFLANS